MVVDCLPKIAAEVAAPLEKVDDIVIVGGSGDGATQLLATLPKTVKAVTGYDISGVMGKIPGVTKAQ